VAFLKKGNRDQRQCKDTNALKSDRRLWRKGTTLVPNAIGVAEELSFLSPVLPLPIQVRHSIHHSRCKIKGRLNETWSMRYAADPASSSICHVHKVVCWTNSMYSMAEKTTED
jgi:hypothetical protein